MRNEARREGELPLALGDVVDGKYRVDRVIGAGGMGVVAVATHVELGQQVALKFLLPRALKGTEARQRFLREARAAVRLKSEHVARVFDVGALPSGEPYTVMEYLEGSDLSAYAAAHAPLRVGEAVEFVLQACEAIVEAHSLGIVHRDLKPHNLFVTRRVNGAPLVKVLDFGISKAVGAGDLELTDSTAVLGSPLYMAPEQMKAARNADARSDIWSLGVILYELLTGKVPFDGDSMTELCLKVVNDPPPPPRELRGDLPESLANVVLRCLAKDPNARFANVGKLAEALEGFSSSGQRGAGDRAWRSLVDTADAQEFGAAPASPLAAPAATPPPPAPHARTDVSWEDTQASAKAPESRSPRKQRRVFFGGLAAGVLATIAVFGAALFGLRGHGGDPVAPSAPVAQGAPSEPPSASAATPSGVAPSTSEAPAASVATASPPAASASAAAPPVHLPATHAAPTKTRGGGKLVGAPPKEAPSEPPKAPPPPATTLAPNGAPILH